MFLYPRYLFLSSTLHKVVISSLGKEKPPIKDVDTVTLYLGAPNQSEYIEYIISLKASRIIFNPGTGTLDTRTGDQLDAPGKQSEVLELTTALVREAGLLLALAVADESLLAGHLATSRVVGWLFL